LASESFARGSLTSYWIFPIRASAALTGVGFVSMKSDFTRGVSL